MLSSHTIDYIVIWVQKLFNKQSWYNSVQPSCVSFHKVDDESFASCAMPLDPAAYLLPLDAFISSPNSQSNCLSASDDKSLLSIF